MAKVKKKSGPKRTHNEDGIELTPEEMEMEHEFEELAGAEENVPVILDQVQKDQGALDPKKDFTQHPKFAKFKKGVSHDD